MTNVALAEAALPLPPRYQLLSILKETPSTSVYRVFDAADRREETIKILCREIVDPQQLVRFKSEFATLAALDHPNVVKVFDFGLLEDRLPYFTMEFFPGRKISEFFDGHDWDAL